MSETDIKTTPVTMADGREYRLAPLPCTPSNLALIRGARGVSAKAKFDEVMELLDRLFRAFKQSATAGGHDLDEIDAALEAGAIPWPQTESAGLIYMSLFKAFMAPPDPPSDIAAAATETETTQIDAGS